MGAVISGIIGIVSLFAVGVMSSLAAAKSSECHEAKKYEIYTAVASFAVGIIMLFISIFFM